MLSDYIEPSHRYCLKPWHVVAMCYDDDDPEEVQDHDPFIHQSFIISMG